MLQLLLQTRQACYSKHLKLDPGQERWISIKWVSQNRNQTINSIISYSICNRWRNITKTRNRGMIDHIIKKDLMCKKVRVVMLNSRFKPVHCQVRIYSSTRYNRSMISLEWTKIIAEAPFLLKIEVELQLILLKQIILWRHFLRSTVYPVWISPPSKTFSRILGK